MHTEDEAKKLWCPCVQVSISTSIDGTTEDDNRNDVKEEFERRPVCIASKCMAWRWDEGSFVSPPSQQEPLGEPLTEEHWRGFCGLAGKP